MVGTISRVLDGPICSLRALNKEVLWLLITVSNLSSPCGSYMQPLLEVVYSSLYASSFAVAMWGALPKRKPNKKVPRWRNTLAVKKRIVYPNTSMDASLHPFNFLSLPRTMTRCKSLRTGDPQMPAMGKTIANINRMALTTMQTELTSSSSKIPLSINTISTTHTIKIKCEGEDILLMGLDLIVRFNMGTLIE